MTPASATSGEDNRKKTARGNKKQPIVSCLECRRMKWKCDRVFPCSHCRKRGIANLCPDGQLQPVRGQQALIMSAESLQKRVVQLEQQLSDAQRRLSGQYQVSTFDSSLFHPETDALESKGEERDDEHGQLVLGDEPGSSRFLGGAGAQYLFQPTSTSRTTVIDSFPSFGLLGTPSGLSDTFPFPGAPAGITLGNMQSHLPNQMAAARWVTVYFEDASFLNNIVDRETVFNVYLAQAYNPMGVKSAKLNNQHLAIVFMILAIGAGMDLELQPYNDVGERFFRLARACLAFDPSESVELVQAVHLMSRYLVNAAKGPRTIVSFWSILGMAVRSAQSIGLHRDGQKWGLEADEVELRRRVFWEIHTEDILQSMTQGRPRLISGAIIDSLFPTTKSTDEEEDISLSFHRHKYRLAKVLCRVNDFQTHVAAPLYARIVETHQAIRQVESDIPAALRMDATSSAFHHKMSWQRLSLRLLTNEGYLFLHRAHFARALREHPEEPLQSNFRFSYVSELEASRVMLVILRDALDMHQLLACRFWIFFFHAFTAFVNFAAVVIRSPTSSLAAAAFAQVELGLAAFESVPDGFRAREDLPTLRRLYEQAKQALTSSARNSVSAEAVDILRMGTTLLRHNTSPKVSQTVSQPDSVEPTDEGMRVSPAPSPLPLPTTLADAVAHEETTTPQVDMVSASAAPDPAMEWTWPVEGDTGGFRMDFDLDDFLASIGLSSS